MTTERPSTQGCTELSCMYHGQANEMKREGLLRRDWEPENDRDGEYDRALSAWRGDYV